MKNLKLKNMLIIILCTVISIAVVGSISIATSRGIIEDTSSSNLHLLTENSAMNLDASINSIEQSVNILSEFTLNSLNDVNSLLTNMDYFNEYKQRIESLARTLA